MKTRKMLKSQYFFGNKLRKANLCDIIIVNIYKELY